MKDLTTTSFGLIIAYVLPGSAGLYGLSFLIAAFKDVADRLLTANADVGLFLLVVAAAVIAGLQINVLRWAIYEKFLFSDLKLAEFSYGKLDGENKLKMVLYVIEENYRYHQFYGGMTIVMPVIYWACLHRYYPAFVQTMLMKVATILFVGILAGGLFFLLMKQRKDEKYWKRNGYKILIGVLLLTTLLMAVAWFWVYPKLPSERLLFTVLTTGFAIIEIATGAAAYSARARYVNRVRQIIKGE